MKTTITILLTALSLSALAQTPVKRALANQRAADARAAQANAVADTAFRAAQTNSLAVIRGEPARGVSDAAARDGYWQAYTNQIGKLLSGITANQVQVRPLLALGDAANDAQKARLAQLTGYLTNQDRALKQMRAEMAGIEAKYEAQALRVSGH